MAETKVHTTSQQAKDLQKLDGDGGVLGDAPAEAISSEEMSVRAAHQGEGGGAWPPHLLKQFIDPVQPGFMAAVVVEDAKDDEKAPAKKA